MSGEVVANDGVRLGERGDLRLVDGRGATEAVDQHHGGAGSGLLDEQAVGARGDQGVGIGGVGDDVVQLAEAGRGHSDFVTGLQVLGRVEPDADTDGGAGGDHVAGLQGDSRGEGFDDGRHVEDQQRGVGVLAQFTVDAGLQLQVGDVDVVGGHRPRAQRAERVERLADEPLLVVALQVACGHVVDEGVAPHVVESVGFGHLGGALADDDADLALVVQRRGDVGVRVDRIAGGDDGGGGLGEHHRVLGQVLSVGAASGVEAAGRELGGVLGVVLADAEDVAVRDERREHLAGLGGGGDAQPRRRPRGRRR